MEHFILLNTNISRLPNVLNKNSSILINLSFNFNILFV